MSGWCVSDEHDNCPNIEDLCSCPCHLNKEVRVMDLWVAEDGSYGQTTIALIDTSDWSIEDWREMEEASDNTRMSVAVDVTDRKGGSYDYA